MLYATIDHGLHIKMIYTNFFKVIGVIPAKKHNKSSGAHGASIASAKNLSNLLPFSILEIYLS